MEEFITVAEKLLIATHTPALNSQLEYRFGRIDKYRSDEKEYIIINLGDRGSLLPEVSTIRHSYLFYEYETPFGE